VKSFTGSLKSKGPRSIWTVIPAVIVSLLPALSCPACWPVYAGLLSSIGVGFFNYTPYLLPLLIIFISVSVIALAYEDRKRGRYWITVVGFAGGLAIVLNQLGLNSELLLYGGITLLIGSSLVSTVKKSLVHRGSAKCG